MNGSSTQPRLRKGRADAAPNKQVEEVKVHNFAEEEDVSIHWLTFLFF